MDMGLLEGFVSLQYRECGMYLSWLGWGSPDSPSSQTRFSCLPEATAGDTQLAAGDLDQGRLHTLNQRFILTDFWQLCCGGI